MKSQLLIAAALTATLAACTTTPNSTYAPPSNSAYYPTSQPQRCYDCGQIVRIESVYGARQNSRAGAVLGGIVGGVAGHEIADDKSDGRQNTATVVGAVAGAVAGNAIENRMNAETYNVHVRMDDGRTLVFNRNTLGASVREGAYVRINGTGFDVIN